MYKEKQHKFIFRNCPPEGIELDVKFIDTRKSVHKEAPVLLAIHGAPGTFNDFNALIGHFSNLNVRVISPNFPNLHYTDKTGHFRHSTEEKFEFLRDFLAALKIDTIDTLVLHSSACYPGLKLFRDASNLNIRSTVLINPAGHRTIKAMKPEWFISNLVRLNLTQSGRKVFGLAKPGKIINRLLNCDDLADHNL